MRAGRREFYDVRGKAVLVTGAGSGIGEALARDLDARGSRLALLDRDGLRIENLAQSLGGRPVAVAADVSDAAAMGVAVEHAAEALGGLDVVIANAGISMAMTPMTATPPDLFERIVDVDLLGVWRTLRPSLAHIQASRGQLVLQSSVYAFANGALVAPYAAAKAGVEQLARALRVELAPWGVTTTSVHFSFVQTDLVRMQETAVLEEMERGAPRFLLKRMTPEEAATAMIEGIEHRVPRVIEPRWARSLSRWRGLLNPLIDLHLTRERKMRALMVEQSPQLAPRTGPRRPRGTYG